MRRIQYMIAAVMLLLGAESSAAAPKAEVRRTVENFTKAGDQQNAQRVGELTSPDFRVVFQVDDSLKTTVLSRATYMQMLRDRKLGGQPRTVEIRSVTIDGGLAHVRTHMKRQGAQFDGVMTLVHTDVGWRLIQDAVRLTKK
ncbi:MAG: nuclear transport factor 2 family protein [Myxococcota bacterium]